MTAELSTTERWRSRVRRAMPVEGDLAFRRRCETILEFLDASPNDTILDCGCGYGFYLRLVPELTGAPIVGVDLQPDRLSFAKIRLDHGASVQLVQGSATRLPFADGAFSRVICSEVLEHL